MPLCTLPTACGPKFLSSDLHAPPPRGVSLALLSEVPSVIKTLTLRSEDSAMAHPLVKTLNALGVTAVEIDLTEDVPHHSLRRGDIAVILPAERQALYWWRDGWRRPGTESELADLIARPAEDVYCEPVYLEAAARVAWARAGGTAPLLRSLGPPPQEVADALARLHDSTVPLPTEPWNWDLLPTAVAHGLYLQATRLRRRLLWPCAICDAIFVSGDRRFKKCVACRRRCR